MASALFQEFAEYRTYRPDDMPADVRAFVIEGLQRAWEHKAAEQTQDAIEGYFSGRYSFRIYMVGRTPKAFYCVKFDKERAYVAMAYSVCGSDAVFKGLAELKVVAKMMGCSRIEFNSRRRGWERVAKRYGYDGYRYTYYQEI